MPGPDYILDITGLTDPGEHRQTQRPRRAWLAIRWRCCGAYSRVYRNRDNSAYVGHCPRCASPVRIPIGPDGTDSRFFEAG